MSTFDEYSYGVVPVYTESHAPLFLIMQQYQGHWGFPKGNPEAKEEPRETALRELKEEVGLDDVALVADFEVTEEYQYARDGQQIHKQVTYFIGIVGDTDTSADEREVLACEWLPYSAARRQLTFDEAKHTLKAVKEYLAKNGKS